METITQDRLQIRGAIIVFGRKKNSALRVMHYEGIPNFSTDSPCALDVQADQIVITRSNPEVTVTLPLDRVQSFTSMTEENFMLKYHGQAVNTSKAKGIKKYYLVVEYDKGILAFWGTAKEYLEFNKLQYLPLKAPSHIEL